MTVMINIFKTALFPYFEVITVNEEIPKAL